MGIKGRQHGRWPLAAVLAVVAAIASAQSAPNTEYRYDNNGNLHQVLQSCSTGSLLCGNQCLPSDPANCGRCGNVCPVVANGTATCQAAQCGLACNGGYDLSGGVCNLKFPYMTLDLTSFATTYAATAGWTTGAPATTRIRYRAVSNDRASADPWTDLAFGPALSISHIATMVDLFPVANYEYQFIGTDAGGNTAYSFSMSFETPKGAYDVGVISYRDVGARGTTCPGQKDLVRVYLDNEDDANKNNRAGWIGGIGSDSGGTQFPFCRINGSKLRPLVTMLSPAYEYAVLSLSNACPSGSVPFWRHFDTEDYRNQSIAEGDRSRSMSYQNDPQRYSPNYLDPSDNVRLFFCMYRFSTTPMGGFPNLSQPYGVFAPSDFAGSLQKGWVYTDDEDASTGNAYGSPYPSESLRIVSSTNNTTLNVALAAVEQSCASGTTQCGGACVDLSRNASACGTCGIICSSNHVTPACAGGVCNGACVAGWGDCNGNKQIDGCEMDLLNSVDNCSACGKKCGTGRYCSLGICKLIPPPPPPCSGSNCRVP